MNIDKAIKKLQQELAEAGVTRAVNVDLAVILHQGQKGEVEVECIHSRSRRAEHAHRVSIVIDPSKQKPKRPKPPESVEVSRPATESKPRRRSEPPKLNI